MVGELHAETAFDNITVRQCLFRGVANLNIMSSAMGGGTLGNFGGIFGNVNVNSPANGGWTCAACFSDVTLFLRGTTNARTNGFGAICGSISSGGNVSNRSMAFITCIGRLRVNYDSVATGVFNQPSDFSGILGRNDTTTAAAGIAVSIARCAEFLDVNFNPTQDVQGTQFFNGLHGRSAGRNAVVTSSYAVITYSGEVPSVVTVNGIGANVSVSSSFFDITILREGWSGIVGQEAMGRTTEQLQDINFLTSQGWVM
ncbi:MAG: hypothetical protein FWD82_04950 [Defluviitaleaceae bacterium]|nr:hypothetical protein [Defluviitaleaceae bacterium]